jgi:hypothetical protein
MIRSTSIRNKVYKFIHKEDEWIKTNITGRNFSNDRLLVEASGKVTVFCSFEKGYAWDGCSPKFNFLHLTWGTPDGKLDYSTEKPMTYFASMFHDALYQYKAEVCISRKEADIIFKLLLIKAGFMWWPLYYVAVRIFGAFYGKWNRKSSHFDNRIAGFSWDRTISTKDETSKLSDSKGHTNGYDFR